MRCRGAWVARPRRRREGWGRVLYARARVVWVMYARGLGDVCAAWVLYARAVEGRAAVGGAR